MNKLLTTIILLCFSVAVNAQQPNWVSLTDTIDEALDESNPEPSKQIYLYQRCAGQQLAMSSIVAEASEELERQFIAASTILSQAAAMVRYGLAAERTGTTPDLENISEVSLKVVMEFYELYMSWLNGNYLNQGSYYENDLEFQLEMELCSSVTELASSLMQQIQQ
jgi:hypothetical protein